MSSSKATAINVTERERDGVNAIINDRDLRNQADAVAGLLRLYSIVGEELREQVFPATRIVPPTPRELRRKRPMQTA